MPEAYGGTERPLADVLRDIESTSYHDGSTGWCVMIGATSSLLSGFLPERWGREIYGNPATVVGGYAMPQGTARALPGGGLEVTGRVLLANSDARWLQAHPNEDPVLRFNHVPVLPQRPATVTVITNEGKRCALPHRPGAQARDYLKACEPAFERIDRAWIVQPDGSVRDVGIANWNAHAQDEAAPGAVIWGPARDQGWTPQFSALLTRFLATQPYDAMLFA